MSELKFEWESFFVMFKKEMCKSIIKACKKSSNDAKCLVGLYKVNRTLIPVVKR